MLIFGAGTGNDVNIALLNGAKRVVAVEIDPVILELGRTRNATAPYADPRVTAVVDDARHFLNSTRDKFDSDRVRYARLANIALEPGQSAARELRVHARVVSGRVAALDAERHGRRVLLGLQAVAVRQAVPHDLRHLPGPLPDHPHRRRIPVQRGVSRRTARAQARAAALTACSSGRTRYLRPTIGLSSISRRPPSRTCICN